MESCLSVCLSVLQPRFSQGLGAVPSPWAAFSWGLRSRVCLSVPSECPSLVMLTVRAGAVVRHGVLLLRVLLWIVCVTDLALWRLVISCAARRVVGGVSWHVAGTGLHRALWVLEFSRWATTGSSEASRWRCTQGVVLPGRLLPVVMGAAAWEDGQSCWATPVLPTSQDRGLPAWGAYSRSSGF